MTYDLKSRGVDEIKTPHIKDSGARKEFDTGAVRDIRDGKGRCDLLPLDVISDYVNEVEGFDNVLLFINHFLNEGDPKSLLIALSLFAEAREWDTWTLILEVAKHYEEGAKKYGEYNWQKGMPIHCYIDSGIRHYLKWRRGDDDEPHDRAFVWNILGGVWTFYHKPELNDLHYKEN